MTEWEAAFRVMWIKRMLDLEDYNDATKDELRKDLDYFEEIAAGFPE